MTVPTGITLGLYEDQDNHRTVHFSMKVHGEILMNHVPHTTTFGDFANHVHFRVSLSRDSRDTHVIEIYINRYHVSREYIRAVEELFGPEVTASIFDHNPVYQDFFVAPSHAPAQNTPISTRIKTALEQASNQARYVDNVFDRLVRRSEFY